MNDEIMAEACRDKPFERPMKPRIRVPSARYTTWLYLNRKRKPDNIDILISTFKAP